jgi:drug/metabolite transporter (DMT)-like permease
MNRLKLVVAFATIYIVWGSTYIAIRIGVERMPWALLAGTRFLLAGALMLGALWLLRRPVRASRRDLAVLAAGGVLLLGSGNGFVFLAETMVPAGLAALVIATIPLWIALLDSVLPGGDRLARRGWLGIGVGLAGLAVLLAPQLRREAAAAVDPLGILALLVAALSWSAGTLLMRRNPVRLDAFAATGYEMVFGGLFNLGVAALLYRGEAVAWTAPLAGSLAYLVVFGSLIAFTAFTWLTRRVPASQIATYAYVNPVVAVLLGVALLDERLSAEMLAGMVIILLSVGLVTGTRVPARAAAARLPNSVRRPLPEASGD